MEEKYRYPGVTPFTTEQANIFFGRKQDTDELYRLIRRESLVVLYGKSGLGKTSLINAGIVPKCQNEKSFTPLIIRFGAWTESTSLTPLEAVKSFLHASNKQTLLSKLIQSDNSLWKCAKEMQMKTQEKILLIFDQFEELFSYPELEIREFQKELSELINTSIPLRFRRTLDKLEGITDGEEEILEAPLEARILFVIRSDRMHLLDRLTTYLPNLLRNCLELRALKNEDARDAIISPSQAKGIFKTEPFQYSDAAITNLLQFLEDSQEKRVEGILLQMLCEHYERKQVEVQGKRLLDEQDIGDPNEVVKNYYEEKLQNFEDTDRMAVRLLIEEGLVSEGESMRLTLHEAYIMQEYKVDKTLLEKLINSRLLRSEPFIRGGYTYELSHDRLIAPVINARKNRKTAEAEAENQRIKDQYRLQQEKLLKDAARERHEKKLAQKRLRNVRFLLSLTMLAMFFAIYFAYESYQKNRIANENLAKARSAELSATQRLLEALTERYFRVKFEREDLLRKRQIYENSNFNILIQQNKQDIEKNSVLINTIKEEIQKIDPKFDK